MEEKAKRMVSLDVFRGVTIMGMILVNNPGSWSHIYKPLGHAPWHGWTPTDFIFPFFLFIVGVAMSLSFSKRLERGDTRAQLMVKVVRRTLILFAIGIFLNLFPYFKFSDVRILGVLQRIALCYFFSSLIILFFNQRLQIGWTIFLLVLYALLIKLIPVPGYGAGVLEPKGNLCWYIDSRLLAGHTWRGAPVPGFDPEGLLSTIPAIATTMLGFFTGNWMRSSREPLEKACGLFVYGNLGIVLGVILGIWLPINKNLWTSSYTVFMAGMALLFLGMCYWLVDIKGFQKWTKPFVIFGANAILVFSLSSMVARLLIAFNVTPADGPSMTVKTWIYKTVFVSWAGDLNGSLFFAITYILIWLALMSILYRKKWFVKI